MSSAERDPPYARGVGLNAEETSAGIENTKYDMNSQECITGVNRYIEILS